MGDGTALHGQAARGGGASLLALFVTAAVFFFLLTPNRPFPYLPDDFSFLAGTVGDMGLNWKRPVSANIIFLVGAGGQWASYAVLMVSAIMVAWLTLLFLGRVFGIAVGVFPAAVGGVVLFSHAAAFEHGKYLGLMTNLVSHGFGLASLLLLWRGWRSDRWTPCVLGALAFLASALAKEDFLLPPLLLIALLWGLDRQPASVTAAAGHALRRRVPRGGVALLFIAVAAGSLAWNAHDRNPFVAGLFSPETSSVSYAVELAPGALLRALWTLFFDYSMAASMLALAACGVLWLRPELRLRVFWLLATLLALALPYAVIPNNMPAYRAYAWLPWMAGVVAVALALLQARWRAASGPWRALPVAVGVAVALVAAVLQREARLELAGRYAAGETVNRRMLALLESHRDALADAPVVGLHGLAGPSPWCGNGTLFLARKRDFQQRWIVFAPGPTPCYQDPSPRARYDLRMSVMPAARACAMEGLPVLVFEPDGSGRLAAGRDVCASAGMPAAGP